MFALAPVEIAEITPAQRTERLANLIRVLTEVGARAAVQVAAGKYSPFDMEVWGAKVKGEFAPACGTQACAAGWAAHDAWFQAQGLTIGKSTWSYPFTNNTNLALYFNGLEANDAYRNLASFFGIDLNDAEYLFSPEMYKEEFGDADDDDDDSSNCSLDVTPENVIERVREIQEQYA